MQASPLGSWQALLCSMFTSAAACLQPPTAPFPACLSCLGCLQAAWCCLLLFPPRAETEGMAGQHQYPCFNPPAESPALWWHWKKEAESSVSWEVGNRQGRSHLSRHSFSCIKNWPDICVPTQPQRERWECRSWPRPVAHGALCLVQLWWAVGDAGEGVRVLQWFLSWSEIPRVCKAVPGLRYTSAATLLLLSCSTYPEKPESTAEAVNFVSFSLCSKCDCQHLQQDTSRSYAHVLTLCIYPCYNLTIPALRHEGQERKPWQTTGKLLWCSLWGGCLRLYQCLQEQRLKKWLQLPFTGSGKCRLASAEGKAGCLPSQGFCCNTSSGILLCLARGTQLPFSGLGPGSGRSGFCFPWPFEASVLSEAERGFADSHCGTLCPSHDFRRSRGGNALHWCTLV